MKLIEKNLFVFLAIVVLGTFVFFESTFLKLLVVGICLYALLIRIKKNNRNRVINTEFENKMIHSPATGKIIRVANGQKFNKITILVPPFLDHGVYMPINGEIECVKSTNAPSVFRFSNKLDDLIEHINVTAKTKSGLGFTIGAVKCSAGFSPRLWTMEKDRAEAGCRLGEIFLGGLVNLTFSAEVDCLVSEGEFIEGGKTIVGSLN